VPIRTARVLPCFADKICRYHDSGQTGRRAGGRAWHVMSGLLPRFAVSKAQGIKGRGDGFEGEQGGGGAQKPCSSFAKGAGEC
jgi:hypothetical protein